MIHQKNKDTHILIVDDDPSLREIMHEFVTMSGYRTSKADSAATALKLLGSNSIEIVITDITMPGMNGLELTDLIKKNYDAHVIVMTGFNYDHTYEEAVGKGASDFITKPVRFKELLLRIKRVLKERQMDQERNAMLMLLFGMMAELEKLAITDGLTDLYNSRHFYSRMELEVNRSCRYNNALSLILLDIDYFKKYNDTYGHVHGDKVLARIGQLIKQSLRSMDSAYRYGGEEFTILLPETIGDEAHAVADRLRKIISSDIFTPEPGKAVSITISAGVTQYHPGETLKEFVERADKALYQSKDNGRNAATFL
ncbi:diguanylate cyclase [Desulfococcaceae bacterium HSG7]|nr:diguanylate cyclase [Desulfococcaceae bacterium HSG7]